MTEEDQPGQEPRAPGESPPPGGLPDEPPRFEDLYEPDVLARIDAILGEGPANPIADDHAELDEAPPGDHGPVSVNGKMAEWARHSSVGAMLAGTGRAIEELLRNEVEIVQHAEDPGSAADDDRPVRLVLVPGAPKASKAFVRPWLLARRHHRGGDDPTTRD